MEEGKGGWEKSHARFSHSMFVHKNYLGVVGGCPVRQHCQELAILDLKLRVWRHVKLKSNGEDLFVRSTASVVGDDLVMIGGGASCYAFGTKFSKPMRINLLPLMSIGDNLKPVVGESRAHSYETGKSEKSGLFLNPPAEDVQSLIEADDPNFESELLVENGISQQVESYWILQLEKKYAKLGKDILKKFGWLDLGRKVYSRKDGLHICFPVNEIFSGVYKENERPLIDLSGQSEHAVKPVIGEVLFNEISSSKALDILKECGATKLADEVVVVRRAAKSPLKVMNEVVGSLIKDKGLPAELLEELPARFVFPLVQSTFSSFFLKLSRLYII